jgi:peptidoglycan/xylan/chitin deacetylase (PgdA/CDA1 family)
MFKAFVKRFLISHLPISVVLMYHRISEGKDYYGVCVEPKNFEEHIMIVRKYACKLDDIFSLKPKGKIFITFDDGYKDNFDFAKKILERYDLPAAFFITTGFLGSKKTWWDELAELFQQKLKVKEIYITHESKKIKVIITQEDEVSKLDFELYNKFRKKMNFFDDALYLKKSEFFVLSYILLKYSQNPYEKLEDLKKFFEMGDSSVSHQNSSLFMNDRDLFELSLNKNFVIGAHTQTHRVLSLLDYKEQEWEILGSKKILQEITGKEIFCFAYPFGLEGDFSEITQKICQENFRYSFSGIKGVCTRFAPRHKIPRFYIPNCDGEVFERKIFEFFSYFLT